MADKFTNKTIKFELVSPERVLISEEAEMVVVPGAVGEFERTYCPGCRAVLVDRVGYRIRDYRVTPKGSCPECGANIPGLWHGGAYHPQTEPRRAAASTGNPRRVS